MGIVKLLNSWDEEPRCVRAVRSKLGVYYARYGHFCACHPWEIIVTFVTLTVCILSMSIISGGKVAIPCRVGGGCGDAPPQLAQEDKVCGDRGGPVSWVPRQHATHGSAPFGVMLLNTSSYSLPTAY